MPKTAYFPHNADHSGVYIRWTKTTGTLSIGGWFDTYCGIQSEQIKLIEFFKRLGIGKKEINKALTE